MGDLFVAHRIMKKCFRCVVMDIKTDIMPLGIEREMESPLQHTHGPQRLSAKLAVPVIRLRLNVVKKLCCLTNHALCNFHSWSGYARLI